MDLELTQKIELTEAQVQMIVGNFVREHFGVGDKIVEIKTNVRSHLVGFGQNEHEEVRFEGMTVTLKPMTKEQD